jgi:hypothetical protein
MEKLSAADVCGLLHAAIRDRRRGVRAAIAAHGSAHRRPGAPDGADGGGAPGPGRAPPGEEGGGDSDEYDICMEEGVLPALASTADGDARVALNALETAIHYAAAPPPAPAPAAPCDTPPCAPPHKRRRPDGADAGEAAAQMADAPPPAEGDGAAALLRPAGAGEGPRQGSPVRADEARSPGPAGSGSDCAASPAAMGGPGATRRVVVTLEHVRRALQRTHVAYDAAGDERYNAISALHKSIRGSDPQATVRAAARTREASWPWHGSGSRLRHAMVQGRG